MDRDVQDAQRSQHLGHVAEADAGIALLHLFDRFGVMWAFTVSAS